jgi:hypothetical protein
VALEMATEGCSYFKAILKVFEPKVFELKVFEPKVFDCRGYYCKCSLGSIDCWGYLWVAGCR